MKAADFAAIMATWELFTAADGEHGVRIREAADLLGAKVPELCSTTCGGFGMVPQCHPEHHAQGEGCGCPANFMECPDCPTIGTLLAEAVAARELARTHGVTPAKLLAIGAAVMGAEVAKNGRYVYGDVLPTTVGIAANLLRDLRAVEA